MRPPSVDALARSIADVELPHPLLVEAAREAIAEGDPASARARAIRLSRRLLGPVVNATGVLLHTNLGRAPWEATTEATYQNVEISLETGERGSRDAHAATLITRLVDAEDGLVVNNGAAAVLLALRALAAEGSVVVSRGELVEIGGGFRIPEILAESGAHLVEVGTTNRTRRADYERAVEDADPPVAAILKVHPSNYRMSGFVSSVAVDELSDLGVPVIADIGSGLLDARCPWLQGRPPAWLADEPAARQTLAAGATLVTFSGDKLLGGPQAGYIVGTRDAVTRCRRAPLARAVRPGAHVLRGVQDLALAYLRRDGDAIPLWRMASTPDGELRRRAEAIAADLGLRVAARPTWSTVGGGSAPGVTLASYGLSLPGDHASVLRSSSTPVIARVEDDQTVLDLRTVRPDQDDVVRAALRDALADSGE